MPVQSGLRYTPFVAGDINGDGASNDRAFIFDPSRVADTAVSRGLRDLLNSGSASARDCLSRQINTIAGRNSCVGPWSATFNAALVIPQLPKTNGRMQATLNLANPLGGLDQLLHGSDKLHGWGSTPFIDGTLYQVRGFDPAARQFLYQVNPRFGSTNPSTSTLRSPFRITHQPSAFTTTGCNAQSKGLSWLSNKAAANRHAGISGYHKGEVPEKRIYGPLCRDVAICRLARAVARARWSRSSREQKVLLGKADVIYGKLAAYLAALPANYDASDALQQVTAANDTAWKTIYAESPFIRSLLTPRQLPRLPRPIYEMLMTEKPQVRFFFGF